MSTQISLVQRFLRIVIPTKVQTLGSLVLALIVLVVSQKPSIEWLESGPQGPIVQAGADIVHEHVLTVLTSPVASATALITFWAIVGLVAYLVCWMGYNFMIEARNEVTLETAYTNRGHWHGAGATLGLKAAGAIWLIVAVALIAPGVQFWSGIIANVLTVQTAANIGLAIVAIIGLGTQFYLVLAGVILTFSPWYRPNAFTDVVE